MQGAYTPLPEASGWRLARRARSARRMNPSRRLRVDGCLHIAFASWTPVVILPLPDSCHEHEICPVAPCRPVQRQGGLSVLRAVLRPHSRSGWPVCAGTPLIL